MLKKIIIFMILIISVISSVYAISEEIVYLETNKNKVKIDEEIEISVRAKDTKIVAYNLYIYFDNEKIEYVSGPENTNEVQNRIIAVWHDVTGGKAPKSEELTKFVFKTREEGKTKISLEGDFYNDNGELVNFEFEEKYIEIADIDEEKQVFEKMENNPEIDVSLEVLAIENELLYPPFDSNITNYDVEVSSSNEKLNIFAVPTNENASLEIFGNDELKEGNNQIKIIVTSQDGVNKREYKINAYKRNKQEEIVYEKEQKSNDEKLEKIYQAEKVNVEIGKFEEENITKIDEKEDQKSSWILVLVSFIILFSISVIIILKKHNRK